jgi:hypothetical protein
MENKIIWTKKKPKFKEECLLITACKIQSEWEYTIFQIKKLYFDEHWYWGILNGDGEEWGDLADLEATMYCKLSLLT